MKFNEQQKRTIAKVITWRVALTTSHIVNAYIVTGSLIIGLQIAGVFAIANSILFWLHERAWNVSQWNRRYDNKLHFFEGNPRSVSKLLTWRVAVTTSNFLVPYFVTGSFGSAALFAGLATVINMLIFWSHERVWNRIAWGKVESNTDE